MNKIVAALILLIIQAALPMASMAGECHWTRRHGNDAYPTPQAVCRTYETEVSQYTYRPATFKTLRLTRSDPITVYQCVFSVQGYADGFYSWEYEASRSDKVSRNCDPCALRFTSPSDSQSYTSANIQLFGYGLSRNPSDTGQVTLTLNGSRIFEHTGQFQEASSRLQTGISASLRPGINTLSLSGSTANCNASDSLTLYYDPHTSLAANKGDQKSCPSSSLGNPINIAIGNKFQQEEDYKNRSSHSLNFSRQYNSADGYWRHSFSTRLSITGSFLTVIFADGRESKFTRSGLIATASSTEFGKLVWNGSRWIYTDTTGWRFSFDKFGRLTEQTTANGRIQKISYGSDPVVTTVSVIDDLGTDLKFTQDRNYQPLTLTAPGLSVQYVYDSAARLKKVIRSQAGEALERIYHYEDARYPRFLTGITDERGVRYATWSYDDKGRAISSEHADGAEKVTVAYNADDTVSVTNGLGKVTKYSFQTIEGVRRITSIQGEPSANCPNSNSSFTYDSNGLLKTKTDNKGVLTTYTYNARGLEISRTEASGTPQARTITTDWHPTLFLPTVVTEPKRITTYHYDDQGRQLSRTVEER